jgi:hypothetical protein
MKKLLPFFVIILFSGSCSKEFDLNKFPQEWKLISMSINQMTTPTTISGSKMEWQETYTLYSDGTFTKSRNREGIITVASGNFVYKDISNEKYFELSFETGIELVSSCYPGKEILMIKSETKMQGTWSACDGFGLDYERIK